MKRHRRFSVHSPARTRVLFAGLGLVALGLPTMRAAAQQTPPAGPTAAPTTPAVPPAVSTLPAPVAHWDFDAGTGTTAADASGKGNDGTILGSVTWLPNGIVGAHALHFAGNDPGTAGGEVDIAKPLVDTSRSFTVAAWVRLPKTRPGTYQTFVSIDGNQVSGFFLQLRGSNNALGFAMLPADDTATNLPAVADASFTPEAGQWYFLAGTYDAAAQTLSFYVDGVLEKTVAFTTPWRAMGHTVIGRGKFHSNHVDYANADIDDVRFYDSALSPANIAALARQGSLTPTLTVEAAQPTGRVSPTLYGLMTEEINYAYDGGLYGELIHNRAFHDDPQKPVHWSLALPNDAPGATLSLETSQPVNPVLNTALRLTVPQIGASQRVGVANDGYWGFPLQPNTSYNASFYARAVAGFKGPLTVSLESPDGATVFARAEVSGLTADWKRYAVVLHSADKASPTANVRFVLSIKTPGTVDFNLVSLFPPTYNGHPNGNRVDLMQKMAGMKPAFLRLPGGNYLEGNSVPERFDWKRTIGPIELRPGHQGPWGYRSTDGMGLLEFLEWCEDLHMEPLLAVYAGYSLNGEHIAPGAPLQPFVQDALDEIEYVTGDKNTVWGARRIRDGHPAPFPLHYVEIGNEDNFDKSGSYDGRFAQFYDAIKNQYPALQLIATTKIKARIPDVLDEHYYALSADMERMSHQYDHYSRTGPKIFVGEWASQIHLPWLPAAKNDPPTPAWDAALGDAAWMTGMERNSDLVVMESYAPLLVNVNPGGRQWSQNLIGYDALTSYGSPSYYAQALFATHVGDSILATRLAGTIGLYESVTEDSATGRIYLKLVNPTAIATPLQIDLHNAKGVLPGQGATAITLVAPSPTTTNSLAQPTNIVPLTTPVSGAGTNFTYTFPPYSVTVLVVGGK